MAPQSRQTPINGSEDTSRRTAKRTQGIYVYMNVCKMSTNLIDLDTEEAYNTEKVTLSFTRPTNY